MTSEELVSLIQCGERELLHQLWEQVERFVAQQANRRAHISGGIGIVGFEDLYQSGYLAMVAAVESYDPTQGMGFIGWLALQLKTAFNDACGYRSNRQRLDPIHRATSLDLPLGEDEDGGTLGDLVPDPGGIGAFQAVEDAIWQGQLHAELDKALATLPTDQHEAVERRSYMGQTVGMAGAEMGVTSAEVRKLESCALRALRTPSITAPLRAFIEENTNYYLHVSASKFQSTGSSAVEELAIRREIK